MTHHLTLNALEASVHRLKADLSPLEPQMKYDKKGMFITYDEQMPQKLVVYADKSYRAYIPKRYDGWDVDFIEWDGQEIQLDLDLTIAWG